MTAIVADNTLTSSESDSLNNDDIDIPDLIDLGELMLALITTNVGGDTQTFDAEAGWSKNLEQTLRFEQYCGYSRTAGASEADPVNFSWGTAANSLANVIRIQNHNGVDVYGATAAAFASSIDSPSVTPNQADNLVICGFRGGMVIADRTLTIPSGTTQIADTENNAGTMRMTLAEFDHAPATATPAKSWSITGGDAWLAAFTIVIAPAAAGAPAVTKLPFMQMRRTVTR